MTTIRAAVYCGRPLCHKVADVEIKLRDGRLPVTSEKIKLASFTAIVSDVVQSASSSPTLNLWILDDVSYDEAASVLSFNHQLFKSYDPAMRPRRGDKPVVPPLAYSASWLGNESRDILTTAFNDAKAASKHVKRLADLIGKKL